MRVFLYIGLLLTLLIACQEEEKVVYIVFDNSEGLSTMSDVMLNGVSVGTVQKIDLTDDNLVLTTVELSSSVDFPKGTLFEIQRKDVFTKIIYVTLGESNLYIERGDTIIGVSSIDLGDQGSTPKPKLLKDIKEMLKN